MSRGRDGVYAGTSCGLGGGVSGSQSNTMESSPSLTQCYFKHNFKDSISTVTFLLGIDKIWQGMGRMKLPATPYFPKCLGREKPVEIQKLTLRDVPTPESWMFLWSMLRDALGVFTSSWVWNPIGCNYVFLYLHQGFQSWVPTWSATEVLASPVQ